MAPTGNNDAKNKINQQIQLHPTSTRRGWHKNFATFYAQHLLDAAKSMRGQNEAETVPDIGKNKLRKSGHDKRDRDWHSSQRIQITSNKRNHHRTGNKTNIGDNRGHRTWFEMIMGVCDGRPKRDNRNERQIRHGDTR